MSRTASRICVVQRVRAEVHGVLSLLDGPWSHPRTHANNMHEFRQGSAWMNETKTAGVVVTGVARGIGAAIADRLAADGYLVVAVDRSEGLLAEAVAGLPGEGHQALVGDVADEALLTRAGEQAAAAPAGLAGFVRQCRRGAAGGERATTHAATGTELLEVNLTAPFLGARTARRVHGVRRQHRDDLVHQRLPRHGRPGGVLRGQGGGQRTGAGPRRRVGPRPDQGERGRAGNDRHRDGEGVHRHRVRRPPSRWPRACRWATLASPDDIARDGGVPALGRRDVHHRCGGARSTAGWAINGVATEVELGRGDADG